MAIKVHIDVDIHQARVHSKSILGPSSWVYDKANIDAS